MQKSLREIFLENNKLGLYVSDKAGGEFAVRDNIYFEKCHEYADLYDFLFSSLRHKNINLLEIGIARGGSVKSWADYFENGNIYAIDYFPYLQRINREFNHPRITTFYDDAYSELMINKLYGKKFDIIIDDGPHTLASQKSFIELYNRLVIPGGYLIVEDIGSIEDARELHKLMSKFTSFSMIVDRNVISNYGENEINVVGIIK